MSNEQRENNLSRRRENYRRRKEQEKQAQTSRPINSQSRVPFQNFTNMTCPRSHFQGTHDSEVGPSRITHVNDVALDRNCTSPNQRNNTSQSDTDDMDVNEALEDAVISYVNMDARENGALSRRPQDTAMQDCFIVNHVTRVVMVERYHSHELMAEGKHFRQHIRSYNHVLSFTSIGVHVDENILAFGRGIYTFRAQGAFYHNIGGFYPNEGVRPRFLQLYIYDTDNELHNRMQENPQLHQNVVHKLQKMLHQFNPLVIRFKQLSILPNISECSLILKERPSNHHQYNLPTTEQVAAIIVGCDADSMDYGRDINVIRCDGNLKKVQETKGYYDPLQYPVLFPFGTHGWDINTTNCNGRRVSCRAYYSYMLQIRPNGQSMLLNAGRLLQQYVVDNYVKIESGRLRWIKDHQSDIRSELYQGLQDALHVGETNVENIGKRTILPS
ncbi:hypothetical protein KIW84_043783 [Lathyrus oleraceus]|uniref:Helitron helicase-like domain-containing protein n=1 Tax=Pisum sativum TaxID=3888 RepID=A0A9D5AV46_PEA|nr:hypothetical protein KIW84_043783 [Pisum sativum]